MSETSTVVREAGPPIDGPTTLEAISPELPKTRTDADRNAMLAQSVANEVRKDWRVQSQTDFQAVMEKGKRTSHGLHLFLSIVTVGLWIPVWVAVWYLNRDQNEVINVDGYGNVNIAK
jgi:hypothetical protein